MRKQIKRLLFNYTLSRGRDTYGYNVVRGQDNSTGKVYRAMGGGYDMVGTVLGHWVQDLLAEVLPKFIETLEKRVAVSGYTTFPKFYGLSANFTEDCCLTSVHIDGACGSECVVAIAKGCGYNLTLVRDYKGVLRLAELSECEHAE